MTFLAVLAVGFLTLINLILTVLVYKKVSTEVIEFVGTEIEEPEETTTKEEES